MTKYDIVKCDKRISNPTNRKLEKMKYNLQQNLHGILVLTNRDPEVVENTWSRVKINTKLPNLKKLTRIEGYSGE